MKIFGIILIVCIIVISVAQKPSNEGDCGRKKGVCIKSELCPEKNRIYGLCGHYMGNGIECCTDFKRNGNACESRSGAHRCSNLACGVMEAKDHSDCPNPLKCCVVT